MTERIYTPWRMPFVKSCKEENQGCVFCEISAAQAKVDDEKNCVLKRGKHSFIILNKYPYTCGHLLVIPYKHGKDYLALSDACHQEMQGFIQECVEMIGKSSSVDGYNIGMNIGKAGGAGIPQHLHHHIVPRWFGDSNFMPIVGGTRVLPETVEQTYQRLKNS